MNKTSNNMQTIWRKVYLLIDKNIKSAIIVAWELEFMDIKLK